MSIVLATLVPQLFDEVTLSVPLVAEALKLTVILLFEILMVVPLPL